MTDLVAVPKPEVVRDPDFLKWLKEWPCCVPSCDAQLSDPAHIRNRRDHGDERMAVPLCRKHHREQHDTGIITFAAKYGVALSERAEWYWARWLLERERWLARWPTRAERTAG